MEGKEYAGQERAWGAIGFAAGEFQPEQLERLGSLLDSQQHCFDIFVQFAQPVQVDGWREIENADATRELQRLRAMLARMAAGEALPSAISEVWYELTTQRIDAMQRLERQLSETLSSLSTQRLRQAQKDLQKQHDHLQILAQLKEPAASPLARVYSGSDAADEPFLGEGAKPEIVRSLYDLVKGQETRLQRISDELSEARKTLTERKRIERAKGLLMQYQGVSEEQAYALLRQSAMQSNRQLIDVAESVIAGAKRYGAV